MAGMFGSMLGGTKSAAGAPYDPAQGGAGDKLALFGAMLKDAVGAYNGDPSDNVVNTQSMLTGRQQQARKLAFQQQLAGLIGGQNPGATGSVAGGGFMSQDTLPQSSPTPAGAIGESLPGQQGGLNINDPRLPALALQAQNAGYDMSGLLDVLKAQQPDVRYDRGFGYNGKTGAAAGGFHPDMDKGQEPVFDQNHRIVGVRNMDGSIQAAADMAGAVKGAEAKAQAPYQAVQTQDQYGRPTTITAAQLAAGANGQGAPFVGQSPAQTAADTARATAGASADVGLPQSQADAQQAIQLIQTLKANPALPKRTGAYSLLPALPGTPGAAFDAADDQLRGKLFMQAYSGLKGGGQITEVEGKKATQAIARLSRSQSSKDYIAALNDLQSVIQSGLTRAQQQPGRLQPNASGRQSAAAPGRSAIEAEMRRRGLIQ